MQIHARMRNGTRQGSQRAFKKMMQHARARSVSTRKAMAVLKKLV